MDDDYEEVIALWREKYESGDVDLMGYVEWLERKLYTANTLRNKLIDMMETK